MLTVLPWKRNSVLSFVLLMYKCPCQYETYLYFRVKCLLFLSDLNQTRIFSTYFTRKRLRWSRGSALAFSTQVRGFKPG